MGEHEEAAPAPGGPTHNELPTLTGIDDPEMKPDGAWAAPATIGGYRIVGLIGRGGMGSVYQAEDPKRRFEGAVALKTLHINALDEHSARRFRQERDILARLDHPNIARILDGGQGEEGVPYLVMELVAGEPVTDYCARHALSLRRRIILFLRILAGVSHAHQRLVVHRDIKPGNILVNANGTPKLLDFGIAKVLDNEALEVSAVHTASGLAMYTPHYAAPEQIRGEPVTTATDIYALGVVLYELLTGVLPFSEHQNNVSAVMRAVLAEEPKRPSTVRARPAPSPRRRQAGPLHRELRGDLDVIVLTALRKEPARRYASVERFAEDLRRYLDERPVLARPDTLGYRALKLLRRYPFGIAGFAAFLTALVGLLVVLGVQNHRILAERDSAERERDTALAVQEFLVELFDAANPYEGGEDPTARDLLKAGAVKIESAFSAQPLVKAALLDTIADAYERLGLYDDALPIARQALALRQANAPTNEAEQVALAVSLRMVGDLQRQLGQFDASAQTLERARGLAEGASGDNPRALAEILNGLGIAYDKLGRYQDAIEAFERSAAITQAAFPEGHPGYGISLNNIGASYRDLGEWEAAWRVLNRALQAQTPLLEPDHPELAVLTYNLATVALGRGDVARAREFIDLTLANEMARLGADHPEVAITRRTRGEILAAQGAHTEALAEFEQALGIIEQTRGDLENVPAAEVLLQRAQVYRARDELGAARADVERAQAVFAGIFGRRHRDYVRAVVVGAEVSADLGQWEAAAAWAHEALRLLVELGRSPANEALRARAHATRERAQRGLAERPSTSVPAPADGALAPQAPGQD